MNDPSRQLLKMLTKRKRCKLRDNLYIQTKLFIKKQVSKILMFTLGLEGPRLSGFGSATEVVPAAVILAWEEDVLKEAH